MSNMEEGRYMSDSVLTLLDATIGEEVIVKCVNTDDDELNSFLFTLGCYEGEKIVIISSTGDNLVIAIKDGRYNIDKNLAMCICI